MFTSDTVAYVDSLESYIKTFSSNIHKAYDRRDEPALYKARNQLRFIRELLDTIETDLGSEVI